jgi:hypothetical protein
MEDQLVATASTAEVRLSIVLLLPPNMRSKFNTTSGRFSSAYETIRGAIHNARGLKDNYSYPLFLLDGTERFTEYLFPIIHFVYSMIRQFVRRYRSTP